MKKIFFLLIISATLKLFAQDKTITSISFEQNSVTSSSYLLITSGLKIGDPWNSTTKNTALTNLNSLRNVVESLELKEIDSGENTVDIVFIVTEKLPFIVIPFFTYSNGSGFMPKLIFRHYNIGGWGKYIGIKAEFLPVSFIGGTLDYVDYAFFNQKDLRFNISLNANTSILNYMIIYEEHGIMPIGVINPTFTGRWNKENKTNAAISSSLSYTFPSDVKISGSAATSLELVQDDNSAKQLDKTTPVQFLYIRPSTSFLVSIPVTQFFTLNQTIRYNHEFETNDKASAPNIAVENGNLIQFFHSTNNLFNPISNTNFTFANTEYSYTFSFSLIASHNTEIGHVIKNPDLSFESKHLHKARNLHYLDLGIETSFVKRFNINTNLSDTISVKNTILQRAFEYNDQYTDYLQPRYQGYSLWRDVSNTVRLDIWFANQLDYRFFKRHHFKVLFKLFYYYNDVNTYNDYSTLSKNRKTVASVEKRVYEIESDYVMGSNTGDMEGYAGTLLHLMYRFPLFNFTTPSFLTYEVKKTLEWDAFFTFFIDAGLAQNYHNLVGSYKPYIMKLGTDKLNLFPGLAAGVRFEIVPKFVPALVKVEIGADIWKLIRSKALSANIVFSFGIDNQ